MELANSRISEPYSQSRSFCRHLREAKEAGREMGRPVVAECVDVPKVQEAPRELRGPVVVDKRRDWAARLWNMDFWRQECGGDLWTCRARWPPPTDNAEGMEAFTLEATVAEYVEYARLVHRVDRKCEEDNALAYPRLGFDGWLPFCDSMAGVFGQTWNALGPPKLKDHLPRWVPLFAEAFGSDALVSLARYFSVSLRATGTVDALHCERNGAHVWLNQVEGRRLFFLFSPQEMDKLYAGYTTGESPVDVFYPSARRHPKFADATAHVVTLYLGQTLVIPSGWWWYSVALEPCVTIGHTFWNLENKVYFRDGLKDHFGFSLGASRAQVQGVVRQLEDIHRQVMADEDSDVDG